MLRIRLTIQDTFKIDKIRRDKKIKLYELCKQLNITVARWSVWRRGESSMPFEIFQKIEQILGVTLDNIGQRFESNYNGSNIAKKNDLTI